MPFHSDSPIELSNGRLVCGSHHLVACPFCTVDYSFMEEILDEDQGVSEEDRDSQDEDMSDEERTFDDMTRLRVGTGRVIPTKFHPQNTRDTPQSLFPPGISTNASPHVSRFIHRTNPNNFLSTQTTGEGFNSLVIATDSEYVVEGVTSWVRGWIRRGWKTSMGAAVKNRDLWECLLGEMEKWDSNGMQVKFGRIPRDWNTDADYHARHAASEDTRGGFRDIKGILV
ncbi:hypothetical protein RU639_005017 [Aspergillus parasiticus]